MSISDFIDEFYVVTGRFTDRVTSTSLYQKYVNWCKGDSYLSRRAVKRCLVSIGGITHYTSQDARHVLQGAGISAEVGR